MALTREEISEARSYISQLQNQIEDCSETATANRAKVVGDENYQSWITGTDYGEKFEEKLKAYKVVADEALSHKNELIQEINSFLDEQERINSAGV